MKISHIVLGAVLAIGSALYAQNPSELINVRFPGPVVVNGVTLPAGDASIQVVHNAGTYMLTVRAESGAHSTVLVARSENENTTDDASVVFDQKDGAYRLNRVLLPDHTVLQVLDAQ